MTIKIDDKGKIQNALSEAEWDELSQERLKLSPGVDFLIERLISDYQERGDAIENLSKSLNHIHEMSAEWKQSSDDAQVQIDVLYTEISRLKNRINEGIKYIEAGAPMTALGILHGT